MIDVVFSDISMPGLDGMALARVISRFSVRPQIVFVTAHDQHAVDAFALAATDYVMKPVRAERLSEAIRRVVVAQAERQQGPGPGGTVPEGTPPPVEDETILEGDAALDEMERQAGGEGHGGAKR